MELISTSVPLLNKMHIRECTHTREKAAKGAALLSQGKRHKTLTRSIPDNREVQMQHLRRMTQSKGECTR